MKDIYNNGEYLNHNPRWGEEDAEWKGGMVAAILKKNNINFTNAVEVGCGAGGILQVLQKAFPQAFFSGYDISGAAIQKALEKQNTHLKFFNEDFSNNNESRFDLLLMIDVVEHVPDYYQFMESLKTKADKFVFHIPLDLSCRTILKPHVLLQQRESVGHIHYFSEEHVFWLLKDCGYKVIDFIYTKPLLDIEKTGSLTKWVKKILRNISFKLNKQLSVKLWGNYSLLIIAE